MAWEGSCVQAGAGVASEQVALRQCSKDLTGRDAPEPPIPDVQQVRDRQNATVDKLDRALRGAFPQVDVDLQHLVASLEVQLALEGSCARVGAGAAAQGFTVSRCSADVVGLGLLPPL